MSDFSLPLQTMPYIIIFCSDRFQLCLPLLSFMSPVVQIQVYIFNGSKVMTEDRLSEVLPSTTNQNQENGLILRLVFSTAVFESH